MRSLIRYLIKNHAFVLFVLLETFALVMVFNYNSFQRAKYLNSANKVTGKIYSAHQSVTGYFGLTKANRELAEENARLHYLLANYSGENFQSRELSTVDFPEDTTIRFIPAMVINNSVNRPFNYITLNKGSRHGIKPDQGIISASGVVGVVAQVSESYAMCLSLLNQRWSVSAKLKKNRYFGSLVWQSGNYRVAGLTEIPLHVDIAVGDTVVTSGYSSIFPEGFLIGTISSFDRPDGENYYSIRVELAVDFKALGHVEVVDIQDKDEINELERMVRDDQVAD
jgi:rod shape-determining protein MreC